MLGHTNVTGTGFRYAEILFSLVLGELTQFPPHHEKPGLVCGKMSSFSIHFLMWSVCGKLGWDTGRHFGWARGISIMIQITPQCAFCIHFSPYPNLLLKTLPVVCRGKARDQRWIYYIPICHGMMAGKHPIFPLLFIHTYCYVAMKFCRPLPFLTLGSTRWLALTIEI